MNKTHDFKLNMPDYSDAVDIDILNDNFRVIDDALMAGLCEKEYTGNNMGSSDPATRKYAWAPWFEIKNENDFDVQVTDRNFETTITIEAGGTYRKYIVGTYYMNFYVQDQHDVTFRWFTDAETRINEINPSGGGSVSSVNVTGASSSHIVTSGGPITSSGTIEIDLAEGYSIPQTNKQTSWDGKAADLKAEIDSSTYVLTLQLKDSAGNLIGNERTIDLPLETMVVDGEYDPQTQKIKLELKNGNYVEFSVADLVSGLQTELSASNKLDPDYIDYDASHRAVSDTEKDAWNGKQNAISDLATIRSGAAAGATAVQPSTMEDALDDKQDTIDSSHKLSSALVSFSTAQNAALSSGIDSTKVGQIGTNQSNILYGLNKVGKNNFNYVYVGDGNNYGKSFTSAHATFEIQSDNTALKITTDGAVTSGNPYIFFIDETGNYINFKKWFDGRHYLTGIPSGASTSTHRIFYKADSQASVSLSADTLLPDLSTATNIYIGIQVQTGQNYGSTGILYQPMIILDTLYASDPSYEPAALPNYDLTRLEAQDRAGLVDVVDSGAKNLLDLSPTDTSSITKSEAITITRDSANEFTITRAASPTAVQEVKIPIPTSFPTNKYVILSGCPSNGAYATYSVEVWENNAYLSNAGGDYGSGTEEFKFSTTTGRFIRIRFGNNTSFSNLKFKFMCCTKAAFGVSSKFVPFGTDPFYQVPINHNMIYRGRNLGATLTDAQHTALSSGNFSDLYLGDYWTKTVTIPAGTYTGGDGQEVAVPAQTNITLKAVIADFDTFYGGYNSSYATINTHHAAVIVTGFSNVVWNKTNSTAGGYVASLIHKWLVGSALPQIETWFGSAKVLSHQKLLTNAITGDAASGWAWSSQKISLLSENQMYGSKVWGNSKAANGGYEPGEAFKHLNVFNHIDANLLFGNKNIWLRDIASAVWAANLYIFGYAYNFDASNSWIAPAALILLS